MCALLCHLSTVSTPYLLVERLLLYSSLISSKLMLSHTGCCGLGLTFRSLGYHLVHHYYHTVLRVTLLSQQCVSEVIPVLRL